MKRFDRPALKVALLELALAGPNKENVSGSEQDVVIENPTLVGDADKKVEETMT